MTTQELLPYVTPDAIEYVQNTVNQNNKADYQKLKKLFDEKKFEAKRFNDTQLDIVTFEWQNLDRDRNWWWQLQALPFLNWYANSLALQSEEEKRCYLSFCLDGVHNWAKKAKENEESPLVWHDHAAAFRVRNLTSWLVFCLSAGLHVSEEIRFQKLGGLIIEHLDWLQEDKNYSKNTNHGFDQAMIALTIGLMFDHDDFDMYRQLNRTRLKGEVTFAFTDEGVHKENSPGYQKMILGRLKQLRKLADLGEQEISLMGERYIEKAETFLRAVTLPNGYLPMIGDTLGEDEGLPYKQKEQVDVLDYSASGYVVVRGNDGLGKEFFMLLKNTHESNYHRHDDDMMLYLYYDGRVVLGDGGLYNYQESDARRRFVRSCFSHSIPYLELQAVRNKNNLFSLPEIIKKDQRIFLMKSMMFGEKLSREVRFSTHEALEIKIDDKLLSEEVQKIWTNFFFDSTYAIHFSENKARVDFQDFILGLDVVPSAPFIFEAGWSHNETGVCVSKKYGNSVDAMRLAVSGSPVSINFIDK